MSDIEDRLDSLLADRYLIVRKLGVGGMATVFLAEGLRHHRQVAMKVLHPELAAILGRRAIPECSVKEDSSVTKPVALDGPMAGEKIRTTESSLT